MILQETPHATHPLKLLNKMYKYEMDPTKTVGATERTRDAGRTDGQTDGRTDGVKPVYPPSNFVVRGYNEFGNCTSDAIWRYKSKSTLAQELPDGTKPLPEPVLTYHQ